MARPRSSASSTISKRPCPVTLSHSHRPVSRAVSAWNATRGRAAAISVFRPASVTPYRAPSSQMQPKGMR